ncbi:MAG TPA: hypothetical protein VFV75_08610 [Candidatus Polarisedimenticolaceae bacterium]|nr:hypothetical protein [Candidatus Polarisedimenticolaceae bacterium]
MSGDPLADLGGVAHDVLRRMLREVLARRPGGHLVEPGLTAVDLHLRLTLRGPHAGPEAFAEALRRTLETVVDDAVEEAAAFRPGDAFCHRCGKAACSHAAPPSARHVCVGYGPTGLPRFEDFAQRCLDLHHPDVDRLYADPPAFIAWVESGQALNHDLLPAFAAPRCALLGQVVAGFYPVRVHDREGRGVLALTFQVMATRRRDRSPRLGLNVLGRTPAGEDLSLLFERQADLPWRAGVRWAQAALARIEDGPAAALEDRVRGILDGLARRLVHDRRARERRTAHAEARHAAGDRPTRQAVLDVRASRRETVLVDERSGTLVVLGARGRTHFFSPEGRLVSSVRYSRDAIERKRRLGLWREARAGEVAALRGLESPAGRDEDERPAGEGAEAAPPAAAQGREGARARRGGRTGESGERHEGPGTGPEVS